MTVKGGVVGGGNEKKKEKKKSSKNNKFLVIVNVLGSTGPIRLVVKEDDAVAAVIESTLRAYAKEGRLPGLGSDVTDFVLYSAGDQGSDSQALELGEAIGRSGGRNFVLCKNQRQPQMTEGRPEMVAAAARRRKTYSSGWKAWFHKSFPTFKF
ncbi:unnamed protein product [Linum tenue]|uniref:DUF7054 domain-containing protein n=1 Tax=Linum tenue TaxID=586396 RepID=A0AAV0MYV1_9ROSI|nr:unnamed protein product [Linum tenue]